MFGYIKDKELSKWDKVILTLFLIAGVVVVLCLIDALLSIARVVQ